MRRVLIYFICVLFACSCNNGKKQAELARQQAYADSIAEANRQAELAEQRRIDSLADCAIGDIKFGMSSKEIKESNILANCEINENNRYGGLLCSIKGLGYVVFHLKYDKLYNVYIEIEDSSSDIYYGIPHTINAINRLKDLFTQKYGEPMTMNLIPDPSDFPTMPMNNSLPIYFWENIGDKSISIYLVNHESRLFHAKCEITNRKYIEEELNEDYTNFKEWMEMVEEEERKKDSVIIEML